MHLLSIAPYKWSLQKVLITMIAVSTICTQRIFHNFDFHRDIMISLKEEHLETFSSLLATEVSSSATAISIPDNVSKIFHELNNTITYFFSSSESSTLDLLANISTFLNRKDMFLSWKPIFIIIWPVKDADESSTIRLLHKSSINNSIDDDVYVGFLRNTLADDPVNSIIGVYSIKNLFMTENIELSTNRRVKMYQLHRKVFRRQNFHHVPIIAIEMMSKVIQPARHIKVENGTVTYIDGYDVHQFWYLRDSLNFTGVEMEAVDWIGSNPDGSPKGMNAQVIYGEADLSIASSYPYSEPQLIFLHPIQTAGLHAFFVQPSRYVRDVYFRPFTLSVWISIIIMWILAVITIFTIVNLKKLNGNVSFTDQYMFDGAIFWVLSSMASKGWSHIPHSLSLKLVMLSGMLLTLMTYTAYTSILISFFSVDVVPIRNFRDIVEKGFTIYAGSYKTAADHALNKEKERNKPNIRAGQKESYKEDAVKAIPIVMKNASAFVGIADEILRVFQNNHCEIDGRNNQLSHILVNTVKTKAGAFVKRGSPFREYFNYKIITLFENGIRHRLMKHSAKTISAMGKAFSRSTQTQEISLTIEDAITPFAILGGGHLLSVIINVIESFTNSKYISSNSN